MRTRLVLSTIAIVLVVLAALAVPVGIIIHRAGEDELRGRLESQATAIAAQLATDLGAGREPDLAFLDTVLGVGDGVRVTAPDGEILVDRRPSGVTDPLSVTRSVAAPVNGGSYMVQVETDTEPLSERFRDQLSTLALITIGGLLAAAALAAVQARQLARPLERLATSAGRIGGGDFSTSSLPTTGIPEIDRISGALRTSGTRVDRQLSAERHFTADATHQLRTGLTGIAMRFELLARHDDPDVVAEASVGLQQTDQLDETISQLLEAARDGTSRERTRFDLLDLVDVHVAEWNGRFAAARRSIVTSVNNPTDVVGTKGLAGQVIDIVLNNALVHGRGTVSVHVEGPAVVVGDEGPGLSDDRVESVFVDPSDPSAAHGRGLPLARRLARVDGGSVEVVTSRPLAIRYRLNRPDPSPEPRP
ncbi:ATP-binding protein [soil metagenome]